MIAAEQKQQEIDRIRERLEKVSGTSQYCPSCGRRCEEDCKVYALSVVLLWLPKRKAQVQCDFSSKSLIPYSLVFCDIFLFGLVCRGVLLHHIHGKMGKQRLFEWALFAPFMALVW